MTVSTLYTPSLYNGDGVTDTFSIGFSFLSTASFVKVSLKNNTTLVITPQSNPADYSVSGTNVVFVTPPATGNTVIIELSLDFLQTDINLSENNALPAASTNRILDKLTLMAQEAYNASSRSVKFSADSADTMTSLEISSSKTASVRANKYIRMNSTGNGLILQTLSTTGLGDVVDDLSPQLGGNLDLNSFNITGTGNINTTGTAATGALTVTGNIAVTGTVDGRDLATDGTKLDGIEALADVTDETNVKAALDGATITSATVASGDKVLVQDVDDSDNLKTVTVQSIVDLGNSASTQAEMEAATSTTTYVSPGRAHFHPSAVKAWAQFDNSGSISASYNITSVTDTSTTQKAVAFTTALSSSSYAVVATQYRTTGWASYSGNVVVSAQSTSGFDLRIDNETNYDGLSFVVLGDI